ncbi:glucose-specific phosphotransferase enzyme IIA component [Thermoanaerobacterium thermosaccharolyticum]|uniref:Glucose-specific phosphotransferase enzyme IIA component n=1 Tax=Thermoanaerobacterium thermosaccharolyticum TaxID=1517 RepID=A0A223HZT2_THETR|nr:PTS glucose transporter subunit IIA [Thermoanaerobacterium thermosaccharolyticum]AST57949.1 glucose-specific phosphotransferase enzyme IIA component [Thermoanaerobacterium thermosaccharolyticum]
MFRNLFGIKKSYSQEEIITSPMVGDLVDITNVSEPVFSQKMMGDGVAIVPTDGVVVSPIDGVVLNVFRTKHAIGLRSKCGIEIMIHIGLETVELNGEGFETYVEDGQSVNKGDKLLSFNLEKIRSKSYNPISPVVITNMDEKVAKMEKLNIDNTVFRGTPIMKVLLK